MNNHRDPETIALELSNARRFLSEVQQTNIYCPKIHGIDYVKSTQLTLDSEKYFNQIINLTNELRASVEAANV